MKNNFITKIIGATLAFAMMIGGAVGINTAKEAKEVNADPGDTVTWTWTASSSAKLSTSKGNNNLVGKVGNTNVTISASTNWSGGNPGDFESSSYGGQQMGTAKSNMSQFTLTFGNPWGGTGTYKDYTKITSISLSGSSGSSCVYTVSATVDGTAATNTNSTTTLFAGTGKTPSTCTFAPAQGHESGSIVLSVVKTSGSKAWYLTSVSITAEIPDDVGAYPVVSFDSNGGSSVDSQQITDSNNNVAVRPTDPTKRGYQFVGWYDETLTNEYDFSTPVENDITLYAKWEKAALTNTYSPALANGDYRLAGEVTAITGSSEFFIQSGNNAMHVGGGAFTTSLQNGNSVDLFGTYVASSTTISNLVYCDKTSEDTTVGQAYLSSLNDVTEANLCKYVRIDNIQLGSGFDSTTKKASIKNSDLIVYYNAKSKVDNNAFEPNDYSANDYVSVHGVVYKHSTTSELGLYITHIEKPTQFVVTFDYNDGRGTYTTQTVLSGANAQAPAAPTKPSDNNYNYSFVGWYTDEACNTAYNFSTPVGSSFPLYAKWERSDRAAKEVIENTLETNSALSYSSYVQTGFGVLDTLNNANTINSSETTYAEWTSNDLSSGVDYSGLSAGQHTTIQLRTKNSNEGVVTTANESGQTATKVTLTWDSHTSSGRTVNVYGKNTAYSAASDLYDNGTQGTLIGSMNYNDADGNNQTTIEIDNDYAYIGIRSDDSALYLTSIAIQWGEETAYTYSDLKIRFTGKVSDALWTRLNSESTITGYGMLLSTTDAIHDDNIADYYELAEDYTTSPDVKDEVVKFPNTKATPNLSEGSYGWSLHKSIPAADYKTTFIAVAYIVTANDGIVFLDEVRASAKDLAGSLIQDGTYEEDAFGGSLKYLADQ